MLAARLRGQILAAVNPAAAAKGIAAGMPLADALSFLPGLATRPAELAEDAAALRRLAEWCGRYSPWTAPDGIDGVKIEITGSAHLWGGEAELAADLSQRLARQGIVHRLAIADTLGAAWAVAHRIAKVVWLLLHQHVEYQERGSAPPNARTLVRKFERMLKEFGSLGLDVRALLDQQLPSTT